MTSRDYYKILGVDENASADAIKKAYRRLAKEYHPDAHPGDKQAEERFKSVSEAYNVLSDPKKKQQYDQMRKYGFAGTGPGGGFRTQGFDFDLSDLFGAGQRYSRSRSNRRSSLNFDDFFGFGGLGDLFSQMLDRDNGFGQHTYRSQKGKNIRVNLEVPFEIAAKGGKATFSIQKEEACLTCKGTGVQSGSKPKLCSECQGTGMISRAQGTFAVNRPCPKCLGKGRIITEPCGNCSGLGRDRVKRKYSVNIAPGSESGKKLRLPGQGEPGESGKASGDLIITLKVGKHRFFINRGIDIYCEVSIDKKIAAQGTKVKVKTIYGKSVELKIPPNTNGDKTFRLKGLGIKSKNGVGDQFVKVKIN